MKNNILFCLLFLFSYQISSAQLMNEVYDIFQSKCMTCHSNANQQGGLDLEGSGGSLTAKMSNVYNKIVGVTPNTNAYAASEGFEYVYKGRPDKSYLFRKINQGLETTINPHVDEGAAMPLNQAELTNVEKELIRQWILLGAPLSNGSAEVPTDYVDKIPTMVENYYGGMGQASLPTPPPAPAPEEGFQIKMGPFYLQPAGQTWDEIELYQKYELDLPADVDVTRIDMQFSSSSHHFIIYDFPWAAAANGIKPGFRTEPDHNAISLVAAVQEATDLNLPNGTAFIWDNDIVLDLNSHYINYDGANTYQAEVYFNVYTQPAGTAIQEMKTELLVNPYINIPNNGNLVTYEEEVVQNGEVFIWGMMGHTHQWGADYKVYLRNFDGTKGDMIYDGACTADGVPGCVAPFFDYQHIPIRYFEPLMPLDLNPGIIHTASWINTGPVPVGWGPTSDDEMMVLVMMYTEDTTGLDMNTSILNPKDFVENIKVYPNPMSDFATVEVPDEISNVTFILFNSMGQQIRRREKITDKTFTFAKKDIPKGIYFFRVEGENGKFGTGRIVIE